jgi:putative hemolysin
MFRKASLLVVAFVAACVVACGGVTPTPTPTAPAGLANPAAVFCGQHGGTSVIRETAAGQWGVCVFNDKSECDEWAYYRGTCQPGQYQTAPTPQPAQ